MRINEIFYSLQGEGAMAGRAAIFVRFSGCNLQCPFCDTDFKEYKEFSEDELIKTLLAIDTECRFVVLTGGEPTLQVTESLIEELHDNGYFVAMESNGTRIPPHNIDWLTISPKKAYTGTKGRCVVKKCDEVKIVYDGENSPLTEDWIRARYYYLQPCDTGEPAKNKIIIDKCVDFIKRYPLWRMSLQQQKILNVR